MVLSRPLVKTGKGPRVPGGIMQTSGRKTTFDVVTFGEAMIRLAPPHFERLEQANSLDLHIGGELNVAVGVSRLGLRSTRVSRLPKNALGAGEKFGGCSPAPSP
jgi:hypothetical protein